MRGRRAIRHVRQILRRQHRHDTRRGPHRRQVHPGNLAMRHARQPERQMQRIGRERQVVDIPRLPGHMQRRRVMRQRLSPCSWRHLQHRHRHARQVLEIPPQQVLRRQHPIAGSTPAYPTDGAKSPAIASAAASTVASVQGLARPSAASAKDARFGTPAIPPKAIRADVTTPPSTVTLKHPQTALIS